MNPLKLTNILNPRANFLLKISNNTNKLTYSRPMFQFSTL